MSIECSKVYYPKTAQDTLDIGKEWAQSLHVRAIISLFGDLGAGKTTLIKGLASGLEINPAEVNSPTFQYLNMYHSVPGEQHKSPLSLFHFDLYRLRNASDFLAMGFEEYLCCGRGIVCIEWAERIEQLLPKETIMVYITHTSDGGRRVEIAPSRFINSSAQCL
jgi:tRNA threonylcarbamoyladenosine biosynthesis protein TsaE